VALLNKRFPTLLGLLVLVLGVGFGIFYVNSKTVDTASDTQPLNVRITNVHDNKFTVSWTTEVASVGKVVYGKLGEKLTTQKLDERDIESGVANEYITHHVTVDELQPNTVYAFRIVSGTKNAMYDNNGSPYSVTTGPTIAETPNAETIYGQVAQASTLPAEGAIVYLTVPGGAPASTLVKASGTYTFAVSTLRTSDLRSYVKYDRQATVFSILIEQGRQQASADVSGVNAAPVPLITMGETYDFRATATEPKPEQPVIAKVEPAVPPEKENDEKNIPGVFNVEPFGQVPGVLAVTILNPAEEGEKLSTARPEFRGKGPKGTVLSLVVTSTKKTYKDTVAIASDGNWSWTPASDLVNGSHNLSLAYIDGGGKEQTLKRGFVVDTTLSAQPAFVATPSASVVPTTTPKTSSTPRPSPSPSVRAAIPATDSGVPVTGVIENTVLTVVFATVIMISGALFLAL